MNPNTDSQNSCSTDCGCGSAMNRREFLRVTGVGSIALLASRLPIMAGPFEASDFEKLIPIDKKLSPEWLQSLFERGARTIYRGAELEKIGMPIGGLCAGQLYLGGDGKLWHWDIFNHISNAGVRGPHYAKPLKPSSPLEQGFALKIGSQTRSLDRSGFSDISYCGEYPMATIEYKDAASPISVSLEAFSPFIPLNTEDSSLPATILQFTLKNISNADVEAELVGALENAVCLRNRWLLGTRRNQIVQGEGLTFLNCLAEKSKEPTAPAAPDIVFEDWNKESYEGWTVEGTAFGKGPIKRSMITVYKDDENDRERVVSSAPGKSNPEKLARTGKLISRPFTIERNFMNFWIGGGAHEGKTCLNLVINGTMVCSATGHDNEYMDLNGFDLRSFKGKEAKIEIVDAETGEWGNIHVGKIIFSDKQPALEEIIDFGTMGFALLGKPAERTSGDRSVPLNEKLVGELSRKLKLTPNQSATVTFVLTWHFPNFELQKLGKVGRHYAAKFNSALAVAQYVADNFKRLTAQTRLWHDTWYDSTLPYWFLDRTFLNTSILATTTCYRLGSGRFWAWEGVGCCPGTCTHVWHYAQAMARLFPELERDMREHVDFDTAFNPKNGIIGFRGEFDRDLAIDGQTGTILRAYREHQISADNTFLKRNWPRIKKSFEPLFQLDDNQDGVLEGAQMNTLDHAWYGEIAWLSSLYVAAIRAGEEMAIEMGENDFAERCRSIAERGTKNIVERLFNGEYFVNKLDPQHPEAINSGSGCENDQVFGQSWAFQVNLGRVLPEKETRLALRALWKYNFTPDVGSYRENHKPGRWFAMAGEGGLLLCTFPQKGWDYKKASGKGPEAFAGYFNECWTGFEYQVAGHMIREGMVEEGLAITRAVHDRYHAARRNPWNEIECSDHYARAMASYGVFLAACGFEYHGPKGHLGFAPKLKPENFRAAFTSAEGWGTYTQRLEVQNAKFEIQLKWGKLQVKTLALAIDEKLPRKTVSVMVNGKAVEAKHTFTDNRLMITLAADVHIAANEKIEVVIA